MLCCCDHDSRRSRRRDSETIQHTLFECKAFVEDRNESLKRLYVIHPAARGLSDEGHCRLLTGDVLPDNGGINLRVRRIRQTSCAYRSQQNDNQQRRRLGRWSHRSPAIHATSGDGRRPGQSRLKHDQVADHRLEPSGTCRIRTLLYIIYFRCYLFRTGKTSCLVSNKC